MKHIDVHSLNRDEIQNILNQFYDRVFELGYNEGKAEVNEDCKVDTREGVILSEGGKPEDNEGGLYSIKEKSGLVEYVTAQFYDILNA
ncbi:hypothetical protein SAMN05443634_103208 [Chishuiella changwenlii]|nr:hypothetical protein [Chishuiella changwenlii]SHK77172.1 hypothetical protein SAMN05443634_103208 [Chishuiella changwenlii]